MTKILASIGCATVLICIACSMCTMLFIASNSSEIERIAREYECGQRETTQNANDGSVWQDEHGEYFVVTGDNGANKCVYLADVLGE